MVRDYVHGLRDGNGSAGGSLGEDRRLGDLQHDEARFEAGHHAPGSGDAGAGDDTVARDATAAATSAGIDASKKVGPFVFFRAGSV